MFCVGGEKCVDELPWVDVLSSGGLNQAGNDAVGIYSTFGSVAKADLAKDHQMPDRLLGVIIRRRHPAFSQECKEKLLFRSM